jgi:hypothetical protein
MVTVTAACPSAASERPDDVACPPAGLAVETLVAPNTTTAHTATDNATSRLPEPIRTAE